MCSQGWNPIPQNSAALANNPALLQSMGFDSSLHPAHSHAHLHSHAGHSITPSHHAAHQHHHILHHQHHPGHLTAQHSLQQQAPSHAHAHVHNHGHGQNSSVPPASSASSLSPPVASNNSSSGSSNGNGGVNSSSNSQVTKSTKGASKMRRDMINGEIANLRDLLPLPSSTRQRLSQLQLMALVCVYVRKSNYFDQVFKSMGKSHPGHDLPSLGFSKAMNGFLLITTQTGKLLYISDNAAEYLGHSMEDLLIHGDSVYDIIDKQDHGAIQSELMRAPNGSNANNENHLPLHSEKRIFLCRMNVSRNSRRQMRFGDQKVVLIEGRFSGVLPLCSRNEPVFLSWCTPVAMPETRESIVQGATNIFTSTHEMDFKFTNIDENGEYYLGYRKYDLKGVSWYSVLHPDSVKEVQSKHRLITQSENERSCILLIRLQRQDGAWIWAHSVIQVKDGGDQSPQIVCTNQILSEEEASVMRANSWLYHYYMVQSRLQYNLAYGGQPASIAAALYPQMMHMISPGAGYSPSAASGYEAGSPTSFASAGLMGGASPHSTTMAGSTELYSAYSPPLGSYQQLEGAPTKGRHYEPDTSSRHHRYFRSSASPGARSDASLSPVPLAASGVSYEPNGDVGDGTVLCLSASTGGFNSNGHNGKRSVNGEMEHHSSSDDAASKADDDDRNNNNEEEPAEKIYKT